MYKKELQALNKELESTQDKDNVEDNAMQAAINAELKKLDNADKEQTKPKEIESAKKDLKFYDRNLPQKFGHMRQSL